MVVSKMAQTAIKYCDFHTTLLRLISFVEPQFESIQLCRYTKILTTFNGLQQKVSEGTDFYQFHGGSLRSKSVKVYTILKDTNCQLTKCFAYHSTIKKFYQHT